jgi:hypothetical protein
MAWYLVKHRDNFTFTFTLTFSYYNCVTSELFNPLAYFDGYGTPSLSGRVSYFYYSEKLSDESRNTLLTEQELLFL